MKFKNITLVTPPAISTDLYGDLKFENVDSVTPPLNLLSLAAYIREHGFCPTIIDGYAHAYPMELLIEKIVESRPDIVGITCTTPMFLGGLQVAQSLKLVRKDIPIVAGGPHVTALSEDTLGHDCFDFGVFGEGELTLRHLLDTLNEGGSPENIEGIVYRRNGVPVKNPPRERIQDLDILPMPAWDLLPSLGHPYQTSIVGTKKNKSTPIITSRGCPGRCTFCDTSTFGRKYRFFSSGYVLNMIEHLMKTYGIDDFLIYDDTFCTSKKRLKEICSGIIKNGWKISWQCCARIEQVNEELLKLMKKAGCWEIEYGIESGDPKILKLMRKGVNLKKARQVIKMTHDIGIEARGNFIFGNIGETTQSLQKTIDFILSTDLDYVQQSFLTPYPGSEVYNVADQYGEFDRDYRKMSNLTINFVPHGLTRDILKAYSRKLFLRFYLRPRIILRILKTINSFETIRRLAISFQVFLKHVLNIGGKTS